MNAELQRDADETLGGRNGIADVTRTVQRAFMRPFREL